MGIPLCSVPVKKLIAAIGERQVVGCLNKEIKLKQSSCFDVATTTGVT